MPTIEHVRGMLLEEALLHLLRHSGYRTIQAAGADPTLGQNGAGLVVKGRGAEHQVDAIADFELPQPFTNPQRLLVEAKCFSGGEKTGLPIVRNAVGVLKDVSEYWVSRDPTTPARRRFHYQYAIFSATPFTSNAERYAFAQDIYLIPLARSAFLRPVIDAVLSVVATDLQSTDGRGLRGRMGRLRRNVRERLRSDSAVDDVIANELEEKLRGLEQACNRIRSALLAVVGRCFPIFLIPSEGTDIRELGQDLEVRISWDQHGWYIERAERRLFSFDLPRELFDMYATAGMLSSTSAVDLKTQELREFFAIRILDGAAQVLRFRLEAGWLEALRGGAGGEGEERRQ